MLSKYKRPGTKQGEAYHLTYTLTDFYDKFRKEYPGVFTKKEFIDIAFEFFDEMKRRIVEERYYCKLPFSLGVIRIKKGKVYGGLNKHRVDWNKSKKEGRIIYHLNSHSNRHFFRWKWHAPRRYVGIKYLSLYAFKPLRRCQRFLKDHIFECAENPEMRDYDCLK